MPSEQIVIASSKPWNHDLAGSIAKRSGHDVRLITQRAGLTLAELEDISPRWIFVPHWSWMIPAEIYDRFEVVIFHMTDLPYGRGGSPLQNLIARGHETTLISALRCVRELDAGPIYLKRELSLHGSAEEIYLRASSIIEEMMVEIIEREPDPIDQQGEPVVFERRNLSQSDLRSVTSLDQAYDLIRMLDAEGYPHAYVDVGPLRLHLRRVSRRSDGLHADVHITARQATSESTQGD